MAHTPGSVPTVLVTSIASGLRTLTAAWLEALAHTSVTAADGKAVMITVFVTADVGVMGPSTGKSRLVASSVAPGKSG